jgi:hypothetical protein
MVVVDAFSKENEIIFSVANKASFARYPSFISDRIEKGSMSNQEIEVTEIGSKISENLKRFHAAEHKAYNAFMKNARKLPKNASLMEFKAAIPEINQVEKTSSFSLFCGTTSNWLIVLTLVNGLTCVSISSFVFSENPILGSAIAMLVFALGFLITIAVIFLIQRQFYLAEPATREITLAIEALKELCNE